MASTVGGPSEKAEYIPDLEDEQNAPQAGTTEERPTQAAIDEHNAQYQQALGFTNEARPGRAPNRGERAGSQRLDYTPTQQEQNLQLLLARRQQEQEEARRRADPPPSIDAPGLSANPANDPALRPRQSTSRLRRATSRQALSRQASQASLGVHSNASTSSFGTIPNANASQLNLRQGSGDAPPPVPPLPAAFRQGTLTSQHSSQLGGAQTQEGAILREGEITSEPVPHEAPPGYDNAAAGSSTGPGTLAAATVGVPKSSRFGNLGRNLFKSSRELDPQGAVNHDLRAALETGDSDAIARYLNATDLVPNPATPSSGHEQNAFHKIGLSKSSLSRQTVDQLFEITPIRLRASAAQAQDKPDKNTPLHYIQKRLGTLAGTPNRNEHEVTRLEYLATKLKAAVAAAGQDPESLDHIENRARVTPAQVRRRAEREAQRQADPLVRSGFL